MCGIVGFLGRPSAPDPLNDERLVLEMAARLAHRGPDEFGAWCDREAGIALGHRRLSIIDLTPTGRQPMISASGRYVTVFNGEIYNFEALRRELESRGAVFRGRSDTEVLLEGAERLGPEAAIRRCVGMFAVAFWDRRERRLTLFRDRMGEKPLYYGTCGGAFVFASELKALTLFPGWSGALDRRALRLFLRFGYIPAPYSAYASIYKLMPGTSLSIAADEVAARVAVTPDPAPPAPGVIAPRPYWSLKAVAEAAAEGDARTEDEHLDLLDARLRLAVRRQMVADVPVGAFLSAGIDSTTVVALMQTQSARPIKTFTVSFGEKEFDEGPYARRIARHLGTDHTEAVLSAEEALGVVPLLASIYDEPFADPSQIPTYLISRVARRHVTVCLSGDGGDEVFAGYNRYFWMEKAWRAAQRMPYGLRRAAAEGILSVGNATWDRLYGRLPLPARLRQPEFGFKLQKLALALRARGFAEMYRALLACWTDAEAFLPGVGEPETIMTEAGRLPAGRDDLSTLLLWDGLFYLPNDNLVKVDRASMAVSLEMRVPLLDHEVVEAVWRMPEALRRGPGPSKWLLRRILYRYVPQALVDRPKRGFTVPLSAWLRGPLRRWAEEVLCDRDSGSEELIDREVVRRRWREHLDGRRNWHLGLWALIQLKIWQAETRRRPAGAGATAAPVGRAA